MKESMEKLDNPYCILSPPYEEIHAKLIGDLNLSPAFSWYLTASLCWRKVHLLGDAGFIGLNVSVLSSELYRN